MVKIAALCFPLLLLLASCGGEPLVDANVEPYDNLNDNASNNDVSVTGADVLGLGGALGGLTAADAAPKATPTP